MTNLQNITSRELFVIQRKDKRDPNSLWCFDLNDETDVYETRDEAEEWLTWGTLNTYRFEFRVCKFVAQDFAEISKESGERIITL